jgi:hypothetical protein
MTSQRACHARHIAPHSAQTTQSKDIPQWALPAAFRFGGELRAIMLAERQRARIRRDEKS